MEIIKKEVIGIDLKGNNYEIGKQIGNALKENINMDKYFNNDIDAKRKNIKIEFFKKHYPDIIEDLHGFSDVFNKDYKEANFLNISYRKYACSQIGINYKKTENNHNLLANNFDLHYNIEDFILFRTSVEGKYSHIGTSQMLFGRDEGLNEKGLGISLSACGLSGPALNISLYKLPEGIHYWLIIRYLLENCGNVKEALDLIKEIPVSGNFNLVLVDKEGNLGLYTNLFGREIFKIIEDGDTRVYLQSTNHTDLEIMKEYNQRPAKNSIIRYEYIEDMMKEKDKISIEDLKSLLIDRYPYGLGFNYYESDLGTLKSIIRDCNTGDYYICWGGNIKNKWDKYKINKEIEYFKKEIVLENESIVGKLYN